MRNPARRAVRYGALPIIFTGALLTSGCSFIFGAGNISEGDLEDAISEEFEDQYGESPDDIDCDGELEGEEDATQTCTAEYEGDTYPLDVRTTSVEDDDVHFEFKLGEDPVSDSDD